jgi:outer membrane immunogenic protein
MKIRFGWAPVSAVLMGIVSSAFGADMPLKAPPPAAPPIFSWTGWYAGLNVGGAWGRSAPYTSTVLDPVGPNYFIAQSVADINGTAYPVIKPTGFIGGGQAGYNWQAGKIVFGIESDFDYFSQRGSSLITRAYTALPATTFTVNSAVSTDWLWTLRPRVGFLASPNLLLYGTGGLAVTQLSGTFRFTDTFGAGQVAESGAFTKDVAGWTAGAGAEFLISPKWTVKAEYLYTSFGRTTVTSNNLVNAGGVPRPLNVFTHSLDLQSNIVRVGVNYHFGGPIVAKY